MSSSDHQQVVPASPSPFNEVADAAAGLRAGLARALLNGPDPAADPAALAYLAVLEQRYQGTASDRLPAFAAAIRDPASTPGVNRRVVLARGQRFLIGITMELEDLAEKAPRPKKGSEQSAQREAPRTPFDERLLELKGIGPKTASRLASRGLAGPVDLLFCLPRRYEDRRKVTPIGELTVGERAMTGGTINRVRLFGRPWRQMMELELEEEGQKLFGVWFSNRRPRPERFKKGEYIRLAGLVSLYKNRLQIAHPLVVDDDNEEERAGRIVPVYPEVPGVAGRVIEKAVGSAAQAAERFISDPLPTSVLARRRLVPLVEALRLVHSPPNDVPAEVLDAWVEGRSPAHLRLAFDEFFYIQLALGLRRRQQQTDPAPVIETEPGLSQRAGELLCLNPTSAQHRVIDEIAADLAQPVPMRRLLQGDVGSGKTLVALAAIIAATSQGLQTALMAPTEILAEQHMRTLYPALKKRRLKVALHLGQTRSSTRKKNLRGIENGTVHVVIGTHALIQESVQFHRLGLAVVDEQHRFGVSQRLGLVGKGPDGLSPHLLVMTATPIPRSLALTVHGDLDISVLDELPPGRTPVITRVWPREERRVVLDEIGAALSGGQQVYVVCPIIEESEKLDVQAAETVFDELCERFGDVPVELLHGRLNPEEKERVITGFAAGEVRLLVTTTVIEVGVDIPNATMMVIEGAERFGLAQLHQLRGRVGRSSRQSTCHLVADPRSDEAHERLAVLERTNDGFVIAEADLTIRGPGELYGKRQAGLPGFRFGHLGRDVQLLLDAREDATALLQSDPGLESQAHRMLREELTRRVMTGQGPIGEESG